MSITGLGSYTRESNRSNITSLNFDNQYNLLWCGDSNGYTRSFTLLAEILGMYGEMQLTQYTKFKAGVGTMAIKQHLNHPTGILALLQGNVNLNARSGLCQLSLNSAMSGDAKFNNFSCMALNSGKGNDLLIGGDNLFKVDLSKPSQTIMYNTLGKILLMNNSLKHLTLGKANGEIEIFDIASNRTIKTFHGHNGYLSDLDVQGNYAATCGCSLRFRRSTNSPANFIVDPLVNIFDLRMMKALAPLPFPDGASFVRFHPKLSNVILIASQSGHLQFVDIYDQLKMCVYQVDIANKSHAFASNPPKNYFNNLQISSNGEFFTLSDINQNIRLWGLGNNTLQNFVNFPEYLEQPPIPSDSSEPFIAVDELCPLSTVGMPYYKDILLSYYSPDLCFVKELLKEPLELDSQLLQNNSLTLLPYDVLEYGRRNHAQPYVSLNENLNLKQNLAPRFISERTAAENGMSADYVFESKSIDGISSIPNCYMDLKIQYSRFGVDDFDFSYYNRTQNSGLENHIDNSYINSVLQVYKYCAPFQNFLLTFLLKEWLPVDFKTIVDNGNTHGSSFCNEIGYLFDMMNKSRGKNCRITNLSEVMNQNKMAVESNLIDRSDCKDFNFFELQRVACDFNNFLLTTCNFDLRNQFNSSLEPIMRIDYQVEVKGMVCNFHRVSNESQLSINLLSPPLNKVSILLSKDNHTTNSIKRNLSIINYLDFTLNQTSSLQCQQCHISYPHALEVRLYAVRLPLVLLINIKYSLQEYNILHQLNKWLVPSFYVSYKEQKVVLSEEGTDTNDMSEKYELLGYVCEISHKSPFTKGEHTLVSFVKIEQKWYLFNDFLVIEVSDTEVFDLTPLWKRPIMVLYQKQESSLQAFDVATFATIPQLDTTILYRDHFAGGRRESLQKEYELLSKEEAPKCGTLIAIDAEFVNLRPEELEVYSDGTRKLIHPKKLSLARVSVIRGEGPKKGIPFMDDYIVHTGHIEDYLTNFSGIEPGDLDPLRSTKSLTTLQTSYRKLWLLLNLGCVFVGHGLQNDFRCINLQVPKPQIRDTAEFFYLPEFKRKLSLKFLAYILLKEKVQTGNHDSIEDAHTALLLYEKYMELKEQGDLDITLYGIYRDGQQLRYKVPEL